MKTSLITILLMAACTQSKAQDSTQMKKHLPPHLAERYCATYKNGNMILMGDSAVKQDVTLLNGDKVTINCAVIKKDGTMRPLKPGECVDKNGNITGLDKGTGMLNEK
jgi:lipopolysaccharide export system protein LptA